MKIPNCISLEQEGQYCISCSANAVERIFKEARTYYRCAVCGAISDRSLVIDGSINWWVDTERTYWHESAGVIVVDDAQRILCMFRKIFPFAYTIPAGHVDKGEHAKSAARRELMEETGIDLDAFAPLESVANVDIATDPCRRGADHHRWHLFRYKIGIAPTIALSDEVESVRWCTISELQTMTSLTLPLQLFVKEFGSKLVE